jgi:hypothetical protein
MAVRRCLSLNIKAIGFYGPPSLSVVRGLKAGMREGFYGSTPAISVDGYEQHTRTSPTDRM